MVVDGVLIPKEMRDLPADELVAYAAKVRERNSAALQTYWELEERAIRLGYPSLEALVDDLATRDE